MARFIKDRNAAKGQIPGSLILIGNQKMEAPTFQLIEYTPDQLEVKELASIEEAIPCVRSDKVSWINVNGIHDMDIMKRIGEIFELHPLFLEDVLNTDQRPRYEEGNN